MFRDLEVLEGSSIIYNSSMMEKKDMGKCVILVCLLMLSVNSALLSTNSLFGFKSIRIKKANSSTIGEVQINIFLINENRITDLRIDVGKVRIVSYQYYLQSKNTFDNKKSFYQKQIRYLKLILIQLQSLAEEVKTSKQLTEFQRIALINMDTMAKLGAKELIQELKQWIKQSKPKVNLSLPSISNFKAAENSRKTLMLVFYHKIQSSQLHAISIFASFLSQCINLFEEREKLYERGMQVIKMLKKKHRRLKKLKKYIQDSHFLTIKMKQLLTNYINELCKDIAGYIGWIMNYFLPEIKAKILNNLRRS